MRIKRVGIEQLFLAISQAVVIAVHVFRICHERPAGQVVPACCFQVIGQPIRIHVRQREWVFRPGT